jgi:MFS family permease
METDTLKSFAVGLALGSMLGSYFGYSYGRKVAKSIEKPELRVLIAMVIVAIWGLAQMFSLAFGTSVDGWLNAIMGMVAGFFFGDGLVETVKGGKKK